MIKQLQYITDPEGHKTAVILPMEEFEELMEDLHMGIAARESKNDTCRPFMEFVEELRKDGRIG